MGGGEFRATQVIRYSGVETRWAIANAWLEKVVYWDSYVKDSKVLEATGPTDPAAREELKKLVEGFCKRGTLRSCKSETVGDVKVEKYTSFLEALAEAFKGRGYVREHGPKW